MEFALRFTWVESNQRPIFHKNSHAKIHMSYPLPLQTPLSKWVPFFEAKHFQLLEAPLEAPPGSSVCKLNRIGALKKKCYLAVVFLDIPLVKGS